MASHCMKVACHEVMAYPDWSDVEVLPGMWHSGAANGDGFLDPYEALIPAEHRRLVPLSSLLATHGLDPSKATPAGMALAAFELAQRTGLLGRTLKAVS